MAQEAAPEDDMMAADRVMAVGNWYGKWTNVNISFNFLDEGKEAFQDMVAAVNSADERVNALSDDLEKTLSKAVRQ